MSRFDPLPPHPSSRKRTWALLAIIALAYVYPFPYQPEVNNPNENVRFFMTAAIAEEGTYAIEHIRERWGWVNDAALYEGHVYSVKAPGTSLLGVPAYYAYHQLCELTGMELDRTRALWLVRMTASTIPMLVFLFYFHRWLRDRGGPPVVRDAIVISIALGSMLYAYATMFVSHTTSAAVAFGAFMILERARARRRVLIRDAFFAGFLAASTTAFEYPGFIASALLSLYALACLRPWHRVVPFVVGAIIPTAIVLQFHDSAFGNPLTPGHRYLEHAEFRTLANEGFFGASEWSSDAAGNLLFNLGYGLFPMTPILLLAIIGIPLALTRKKMRLDAAVALAIPLGTFFLICTMNNWRGGWTVGPRYLALALPFMGFFALEGARWMARAIPRLTNSIAIGATGAALVASAAPSVYYPHIPEAFTRPLPQLVRPLMRHDFAPPNAGTWLADRLGDQWSGTSSMLPLFSLWFLSLFWIAGAERKVSDRLLSLMGAAFVGSTLLGPIVQDDVASSAAARDALAYVVRFWQPEGEDRAARLETHLRHDAADEASWTALIHTYEEEGRTREARAAERRARQAARTP